MANKTPPDGIYAWDLLWVGFLALYAFAGYALVPFHGDESMQIFMSRDFAYHFLQDDAERLRYNPEAPLDLEQNLRLINGTVNKYTIGLAWWLDGFSVEHLNGPWYWEESYDDNVSFGTLPSMELLTTARLPSALFLTGSVVLMFFVAKLFAGRPVAYMATLYYALNPAVLLNGRRAVMEGSLLLGVLAVLLAGIGFVRVRGWRVWLLAVLLGLASGFAVASKHTSAFVLVSVFLGCGLHAFFRRTDARFVWERACALLVAGVLAVGVFVALNPAWWSVPTQTAAFVLEERTALLRGQVATNGGYDSAWEQIGGFYRQVFGGRAMLYELVAFPDPLMNTVADYNQSRFAGFAPPGTGVVMLSAFALGLLCLLGVLHLPDIDPDARWVVSSYTVFMTLFVLFVTPLEWQRYYLPVLPAVGLVAPLGIVWVVRLYVRNAAQESPTYRKGSARASRQG